MADGAWGKGPLASPQNQSYHKAWGADALKAWYSSPCLPERVYHNCDSIANQFSNWPIGFSPKILTL